MRKVIDLENISSNWKISGHIPNNNDGRARSKYHLKARNLLRQTFPTCQILEEVPIKVRRAETLYLDFFIPLHDLCIEVHGEQHYRFVKFYHKTKLGFAQARKRDKKKVEKGNASREGCGRGGGQRRGVRLHLRALQEFALSFSMPCYL